MNAVCRRPREASLNDAVSRRSSEQLRARGGSRIAGAMRILWSIVLVLLFVPGWSGTPRVPLLGTEARIVAVPVALDAARPALRRVGDLVFEGGVALSSPDPAFGGFSSLHVAGDHVTLLSDEGNIVRFRLGPDWRVRDAHFSALPDGPGHGWDKRDRDSEAMSVDSRNGAVWVAFENSNALWRYDPALTRAEAHVVAPAMRAWPLNEGPEAMTLLPGGGMVAIAETTAWPHARGRAGILFRGDPTVAPRRGFRFAMLPPPGYDPSDMALLPDGRWLILYRRLHGVRFEAKLAIVDPPRVRRGATVAGRVIAYLAAPLLHDNFEGVAVTRTGTATIIWLVSDDNRTPLLQRSLLLKFRLDPPGRSGG